MQIIGKPADQEAYGTEGQAVGVMDAAGSLKEDQAEVLTESSSFDEEVALIPPELIEEERLASLRNAEEFQEREAQLQVDSEKSSGEKRNRLHLLLEKAGAYANFLRSNLVEASAPIPTTEPSELVQAEERPRKGRKRANATAEQKNQKRIRAAAKYEKAAAQAALTEATSVASSFKQPRSMTGGTLRDYQLQGVRWLASLFENGINGILADEMGLGKTIQVIGLFAHLIEHNVPGPMLVVAPLSTLSNWQKEIEKWTPSIGSVLYHGTQQERETIRSSKIANAKQREACPIVITSYEIAMRDRKYLTNISWKYLVVDEGHRLKNMNCRLIRELKLLSTENRLLLSGTPLQNNLVELWSLLNFLLPDIFDELDVFEKWFGFDSYGENKIIDAEANDQMVSKLHDILRPFLLRRVKSDVVKELPEKVEVVVYAGKSPMQQEYQRLIASKELGSYLEREHGVKGSNAGGTGSLMNTLMQLRKCCNHPYLFGGFRDDKGHYLRRKGKHSIVQDSGKMQVLDRMLAGLKAAGHRVLLFSQMTTMLDIIEDYMDSKGYSYCRIDGSTPMAERHSEITAFNGDDSIFCFLLSTRAGGLGINLKSADTVILFDSDWNPHQDNQAQDRCHRIGQEKNVVVYRLITRNSVENKILMKANAKRKLARLVISRGQFKDIASASSSSLTADELREILRDDVSIQQDERLVEGIADRDLTSILDRERLIKQAKANKDEKANALGSRRSTKRASPKQQRLKEEKDVMRGFEIIDHNTES